MTCREAARRQCLGRKKSTFFLCSWPSAGVSAAGGAGWAAAQRSCWLQTLWVTRAETSRSSFTAYQIAAVELRPQRIRSSWLWAKRLIFVKKKKKMTTTFLKCICAESRFFFCSCTRSQLAVLRAECSRPSLSCDSQSERGNVLAHAHKMYMRPPTTSSVVSAALPQSLCLCKKSNFSLVKQARCLPTS